MSGKLYQIYSPSLDMYYIGSTFMRLSIRKSIHKYHCKLFSQGKFHFLYCYNIVKQDDAQYTLIQEYPNITKRELLDKETETIINMRKIHGGKILNKSNSGLTCNLIEYNKNYYLKNKETRKQQQYKKTKKSLTDKLNQGGEVSKYKQEKYGILYNFEYETYY